MAETNDRQKEKKKECGNCHWFLYPELCVIPGGVKKIPEEKICEEWTSPYKYRRT